ncbi:hypothetical protein AYI68_g243 [Smittium mucronatum]|uniref:Uncharacterized protein n=1 Tax=Smittium mucronatum TaxID=133383 RepID=A0A1R0H8W8_9FUNG|nr:hypothetical protein AYI68_g243 [Smittium mucronatum]
MKNVPLHKLQRNILVSLSAIWTHHHDNILNENNDRLNTASQSDRNQLYILNRRDNDCHLISEIISGAYRDISEAHEESWVHNESKKSLKLSRTFRNAHG